MTGSQFIARVVLFVLGALVAIVALGLGTAKCSAATVYKDAKAEAFQGACL